MKKWKKWKSEKNEKVKKMKKWKKEKGISKLGSKQDFFLIGLLTWMNWYKGEKEVNFNFCFVI